MKYKVKTGDYRNAIKSLNGFRIACGLKTKDIKKLLVYKKPSQLRREANLLRIKKIAQSRNNNTNRNNV